MTGEEAQIWSAYAEIASSIVAVFGFPFIFYQLLQTRKSIVDTNSNNDLEMIFSFLNSVKDYERILLQESDAGKKNAAFIDYMNFLEACAAALNEQKFQELTRKMVHEKVATSLSIFWAREEYRTKISSAITSPDTFEELRKFIENNKSTIVSLADSLQKSCL